MEFEITNDEEAESMINDIRADLAHIDRATPKDRLATLRHQQVYNGIDRLLQIKTNSDPETFY